MSEKISLNYGLFKGNMNDLKTSVNKLESSMSKSESFDKTNITPFINDLENMISALEMLERYKSLFLEDIEVINDAGEKLKEQDEVLSQTRRHDIRDGYQPIQI